MKLLIFLAIFIFSTNALTSRFKSLKCVSLNETVIFHNCYIKPYSRNYSTINFSFTHKLPFVAPFTLNYTVKYRYGTIFRQIFHAEFDMCEVFGRIRGNKLVMKVIALLKDSVPDLFQPCPLPARRFIIQNMTFNDEAWKVPIPQGLYRHELTFVDAFFVAFNNEAVSDMKTSW